MAAIVLSGVVPSGATKQMRIAWDNLLTRATTTTDSAAVGFEHTLAYNGQPFNFWKPATGGSHYLRATFTAAQTANYFAFYAHTAWSTGATISLQYSTNSGTSWTTAASITPSTSAPVYIAFPPVSATYWQIVMSTPSLLGCVSFGMDMLLPHGCWNGFSPPVFARDTMVTNATSETGTFLGRSIVKRGSACILDLGPLDTTWMRTYWLPFQQYAELAPFWLLWNSVDYPLEAAFCWADGPIDKPTIMQTRFMQTKFKLRCRID